MEAFLREHPDGVIVNLGCGLETRSLRVHNGRALWFDLDLPEVIALRSQLVKQTEQCRFIAMSVLDYGWMDVVRATGRTEFMFLAEGLFMYLEDDQVHALVLKLLESFPGCELVAEVVSGLTVRLLQTRLGRVKFERQLSLAKGVTFKSGVNSERHFEGWHPSIKFIDSWTYFDENERKLGYWMRVLGALPVSRYMQFTVHCRLG